MEKSKIEENAALIANNFRQAGGEMLSVSSRELMDGFFMMNGMASKADEICRLLSALSGEGEEVVRRRLIDELGMFPCKAETLFDFISNKGSLSDWFFALDQYRGMVKEYDLALDDLKALVHMLIELGVDKDKIRLDLSLSGGIRFRIDGKAALTVGVVK